MARITEVNGFYTYPWQNKLEQARLYVEWCGYQAGADMAVGDNDIGLDVILPPGVDEIKARAKFTEANFSPCTLYLQTPPDNVSLPPAPPELAPPWWAGLKLTQPKTKIYTAHDRVNVYRSVSAKIPPQVVDVARVAMVAGTAYDMWAAPYHDANGLLTEWLIVFNGDVADPPQPGFILWVSAHDMRAMP